jgi:hypothetical protein
MKTHSNVDRDPAVPAFWRSSLVRRGLSNEQNIIIFFVGAFELDSVPTTKGNILDSCFQGWK